MPIRQRPPMTMPQLRCIFSRSSPLQDFHDHFHGKETRTKREMKRNEKKKRKRKKEKSRGKKKEKTDESGPLQFSTIRRWNFKIPTNATSGQFETDAEQPDTALHEKVLDNFIILRPYHVPEARLERGFYTKHTTPATLTLIKPVPVETGK